ncbi:MAG: hypothetical protein H7Y00_14785, partial [Fimbriimonadaceae bacterium]|nr:hypothetical protein [Chitinophagales bacterium]
RSGIWYLYIDKDWDNNGKFAPYETIAITPETTKNWHVHDFNFTEAGKYKAYMMLDGVVQGSTYFELFMDGTAASGVTTTTTTGVTTDYYEAANIIFCQAIDDKGQLTGISSQYYLGSKGSADVMVYLTNSGQPFKAKTLYVEVYDSETYETLYDYDITLEEDWDWVKFQQTFTTPGEYYFEVYTSDYIYVTTSGAVNIK